MLEFRYLRRAINGPRAAQLARLRTGMAGDHPLWTNEETEVIRRLYPDYDAIRKALPHRTFMAIKARAFAKGIPRRRHKWTAAEISRLRKLAATAASDKQLMAEFRVGVKQVKGVLRHRGIRRARKPFKPTGHPLLDQIRVRCHERKMTLAELDRVAGTGSYFRHCWASATIPGDKLAKVVAALDGEVRIVWRD